jgi:hypothetical protein
MVRVKTAVDWTGVAVALDAVKVGLGWMVSAGVRVNCIIGKVVGRPVVGVGTVGSGGVVDPLPWQAASRHTSPIQDRACPLR